MGRFTTGDIEYKFMVAVQSSRAADRFGYLGETIFYEVEETKEVFSIEIHYIFDKNDLRYVKEELENNDSLFNEASNYLAFLVPKLQEEDMIAFVKKIKLDEEFYKIVGE